MRCGLAHILPSKLLAHRGAPSLSTLAMKGAGSPDPLLRRLEAMAALAVSSAPGGVKAR